MFARDLPHLLCTWEVACAHDSRPIRPPRAGKAFWDPLGRRGCGIGGGRRELGEGCRARPGDRPGRPAGRGAGAQRGWTDGDGGSRGDRAGARAAGDPGTAHGDGPGTYQGRGPGAGRGPEAGSRRAAGPTDGRGRWPIAPVGMQPRRALGVSGGVGPAPSMRRGRRGRLARGAAVGRGAGPGQGIGPGVPLAEAPGRRGVGGDGDRGSRDGRARGWPGHAHACRASPAVCPRARG